MIKTSNAKASRYVDNRKPFKGSNTFGEYDNKGNYVVYSYGYHFPLYVYSSEAEKWFGNSDKYSRTTSKHSSQLWPNGCEEYRTTAELQKMID